MRNLRIPQVFTLILDRFILAETDAFFFLCVINCNDIVIGLLEVAYDIRNNFFLKCCFFYPL